MSLVKKGLSDSKYYLIAKAGNKGLAFILIPILAKTVSIEEVATYDLFLIISAFLQILVILGTDSGVAILLSESKNDDEKLSFYYVVLLLIGMAMIMLLSLLLAVAFCFVDKDFLLKDSVWGLAILYMLFNMVNYQTYNFLRWREDAKKAAFVNLFAYVVGVVVGLIFLYHQNSIDSYLKGLVAGLFFGTLMSIYISRELIIKFRILDNYKELLKELFSLSLPFVPNYLAGNLTQMADRVIILMLFGKYELGLYAIIMRLALIPQFIIGTVIGGFLPVLFNNYKTSDGGKLIRDFFHYYLAGIPILFVLFYLSSEWLIMSFASEEYVMFSNMLPVALMSILYMQSGQANGFGFSIARKTHYIVYITVLAVLVNFVFSMSLGFWIGLEGIILGTLIAGIIRTILFTYYSEKFYMFGYSFSLIVLVSIVSLAMALVLAII